jgi:hypothetical protein
VNLGAVAANTAATVEAMWQGFVAPGSGIDGYHWAVMEEGLCGPCLDPTNASLGVTWTYVGLAQNASVPTVALRPAVSYRVGVYATSALGVVSSVACSGSPVHVHPGGYSPGAITVRTAVFSTSVRVQWVLDLTRATDDATCK